MESPGAGWSARITGFTRARPRRSAGYPRSLIVGRRVSGTSRLRGRTRIRPGAAAALNDRGEVETVNVYVSA